MDQNIYNDIIAALPELQLQVIFSTPKPEDLAKVLAGKIDELINTDFTKLINLLYRLDISENKLKELLSQTNVKTAGEVIASMIIYRELEKAKMRTTFAGKADISEDEKW